jgi:hypothetical protein
VDKSEICLPPLHIKLALIKIYVKATYKEREGGAYLRQAFPKISEAKIKEGISLVLKYNNYLKTMTLV